MTPAGGIADVADPTYATMQPSHRTVLPSSTESERWRNKLEGFWERGEPLSEAWKPTKEAARFLRRLLRNGRGDWI